MFGLQELLVILLIVLVLFGGKRVPELARGIGEAIKELRAGISGTDETNSKAKNKKEHS